MTRPRKHDGVVYRRNESQFSWMRYLGQRGPAPGRTDANSGLEGGAAETPRTASGARRQCPGDCSQRRTHDRPGMGGVVSGELLQATVALGQDARIPPTGDQTPGTGVRKSQTDGSLGGHDRRLLADPVAARVRRQTRAGMIEQGGCRRVQLLVRQRARMLQYQGDFFDRA